MVAQRDGSGDASETWGIGVHTRLVYEAAWHITWWYPHRPRSKHLRSFFFSSIFAELNCANNGCRAFCWTCFSFTESLGANYVTSGGHVSLLKDILRFAKRRFETRQKADWKAPRRWKEFGFSSQRIEEEAALTRAGLPCQDASTGCKYWHVMQPWATSAKRWRKREKSTQRILICMWMSVNKNVWHIAKDSSWRWQVGGEGGDEKICTHDNKVVSVWRRRNELVCVPAFCTCQ